MASPVIIIGFLFTSKPIVIIIIFTEHYQLVLFAVRSSNKQVLSSSSHAYTMVLSVRTLVSFILICCRNTLVPLGCASAALLAVFRLSLFFNF